MKTIPAKNNDQLLLSYHVNVVLCSGFTCICAVTRFAKYQLETNKFNVGITGKLCFIQSSVIDIVGIY